MGVRLVCCRTPERGAGRVDGMNLWDVSMAGKHRKVSRRKSRVSRRLVPGLTAAAVSATSLTTALSTGAATSTPVQLVALITPANSTSQIFAGTTYYGTDYSKTHGTQHVVPFFLGPQGTVDAT